MDLGSTTVVIMAGGKSSRFGSNKALAKWANGTILDQIIKTVKKITPLVVLSVRDPGDYPEISLKKVPDIVKDIGPIGGLYSALRYCDTNRVMLIACDMPLISERLIKYMLQISTWAPVIIPREGKRLHPLHAIYHVSLLPLVEHLIKRGRFTMASLLDLVPVRYVTEEEVGQEVDFSRCLSNVNTPEEFSRVLARASV